MAFVRSALFQVHWLVGLTTGLVLAVIGVTGALLSFETELVAALNPGIVTLTRGPANPLAPPELLARIVDLNPDRRVVALELDFTGERNPRVGFAPLPGAVVEGPAARRAEWRYADLYSGALLEPPRGETFFRTTRELHRYLVAGDTGKQIVGASTVALVLLVLTGIYIRWPRNARSWRAWTHINTRLRGRAFLYRLHAVVGTWVLPVYLLAAVTGLTWSYEWFRTATFTALGAPVPQRPTAAPESSDDSRVDVAAMLRSVWPTVSANAASIGTVNVSFPDTRTKPVEIRYIRADAPHERAFNRLSIDAESGAPVLHERFADKPVGARIAGSLFPLHRGSYFGIVGIVLTMLASLLMPVFAVTGLLMYAERHRSSRRDVGETVSALSKIDLDTERADQTPGR